MNWNTYIESKPKVLFGKPVIKNTRIPVELILEKLANGDEIFDILEAYPKLTKNQIYACLFFASESVKNELIFSKVC